MSEFHRCMKCSGLGPCFQMISGNAVCVLCALDYERHLFKRIPLPCGVPPAEDTEKFCFVSECMQPVAVSCQFGICTNNACDAHACEYFRKLMNEQIFCGSCHDFIMGTLYGRAPPCEVLIRAEGAVPSTPPWESINA